MEPSQDLTHPIALQTHPDQDQLENYALGRLSGEEEIERIETHLLICHACQDELAATDDYVAAMKGALAEREAILAEPKPAKWWNWRPVPAFSLALAALSVAVVVSYQLTPSREIAGVTLRSVRGAREAADAPANTPLNLTVQSDQLKVDSTYRVEVVDAAGNPVWSGSPEGTAVKIEKGFSAGAYWVRLKDASGTLVQEYGLNLK